MEAGREGTGAYDCAYDGAYDGIYDGAYDGTNETAPREPSPQITKYPHMHTFDFLYVDVLSKVDENKITEYLDNPELMWESVEVYSEFEDLQNEQFIQICPTGSIFTDCIPGNSTTYCTFNLAPANHYIIMDTYNKFIIVGAVGRVEYVYAEVFGGIMTIYLFWRGRTLKLRSCPSCLEDCLKFYTIDAPCQLQYSSEDIFACWSTIRFTGYRNFNAVQRMPMVMFDYAHWEEDAANIQKLGGLCIKSMMDHENTRGGIFGMFAQYPEQILPMNLYFDNIEYHARKHVYNAYAYKKFIRNITFSKSQSNYFLVPIQTSFECFIVLATSYENNHLTWHGFAMLYNLFGARAFDEIPGDTSFSWE